jgi:hypothetical protein
MGNNKNPKNKVNPKTEKLPRHLEIYSDEKRIFWSFSMYDSGMVFPQAGQPELDFCTIASALRDTERRTWADFDSHFKRDHAIECDRLAKFARDRLAEIQLDDTDELYSVHFTGKIRLWGLRDGSLFRILWLDPLHEVCPSNKKHT